MAMLNDFAEKLDIVSNSALHKNTKIIKKFQLEVGAIAITNRPKNVKIKMSSSKGVFVMAIAPTSNWIFWGTFSNFSFLCICYRQ